MPLPNGVNPRLISSAYAGDEQNQTDDAAETRNRAEPDPDQHTQHQKADGRPLEDQEKPGDKCVKHAPALAFGGRSLLFALLSFLLQNYFIVLKLKDQQSRRNYFTKH